MSKNRNKYIRDRVSTYSPNIKKATKKHFGVSNALIIKAVNGDEKALTQIGDMGKTGERLKTAMPLITQNLKNYIEGITEYNSGLAEILKAGSQGALVIDKAGSDLTLENTKYVNKVEEYKQQLFANLEKENNRHGDAIDIIELNAWIDSQMADVEQKARLESSTNKPLLAQMRADEDYENRKIKHMLENGSESNLDLVPRKDFSTNPIVKMWSYVRSIFS